MAIDWAAARLDYVTYHKLTLDDIAVKYHGHLSTIWKLAAREVLIGSTNDKFLVIREGLSEGQEVVMNPRAHLEEVGLPAVDVETAKIASDGKSSAEKKPSQSNGAETSGEVGKPAGEATAKAGAKTDGSAAADAGPGG